MTTVRGLSAGDNDGEYSEQHKADDDGCLCGGE